MSILIAVIGIFILLESSNVILLYFAPESKKGNGTGIFNAFHESKKHPEIHRLIKYLINWVAGTKLIFICLLVVIIIWGNSTTQLAAVIALLLSIASFYWRLYPLIKEMDIKNEISPKGFSKTLGVMIGAFLAVFIISLLIYNLKS